MYKSYITHLRHSPNQITCFISQSFRSCLSFIRQTLFVSPANTLYSWSYVCKLTRINFTCNITLFHLHLQNLVIKIESATSSLTFDFIILDSTLTLSTFFLGSFSVSFSISIFSSSFSSILATQSSTSSSVFSLFSHLSQVLHKASHYVNHSNRLGKSVQQVFYPNYFFQSHSKTAFVF